MTALLLLCILTFQAKVHFKRFLLFLLFSFSIFLLFIIIIFFFAVLQSTFPEQPQEPSYIKLQHKDLVRIMNPHLHRHLYSDLPGYKLGRSSGILSRGFHGKLWLLKLLSAPPLLSIRGGRWSLMTTCFLGSTLATSSFSILCQFQAEWGQARRSYSSRRYNVTCDWSIKSKGRRPWERQASLSNWVVWEN